MGGDEKNFTLPIGVAFSLTDCLQVVIHNLRKVQIFCGCFSEVVTSFPSEWFFALRLKANLLFMSEILGKNRQRWM